jgi:acetate CoA/acetoacetate CoA-transferase alpha subunit
VNTKPVMSAAEAAALVKEGDRLMCAGFLGCGAAQTLIDALAERGTKNLELVVIATDFHGSGRTNGVAPLIVNEQCSQVYTSHIGTNTESQRQYHDGTTKFHLTPQGNLIERVRAAGAGLGGVLTPTGIGTEVEEGKRIIDVNGRRYILELPLPGDVAFLRAEVADEAGNLVYAKSARNINPQMAMACTTVIAEVGEIVPIGELDPERVVTPGIFVTHLVKREAS